MVTFWQRVKAFFWCDHQWRFVKTIDEQDLRSGMKHRSAIYICRRCEKRQTLEQR